LLQHSAPIFEYFGYLGICVLPAEMLNNTMLTGPESGKACPGLRQCWCQDGQRG
jgi:hypothetical protein